MKNLFLHNQKHVNNILANQNYQWLVDRMGPAMMYSSSQNSLRSIAMHDCLSLIIYFKYQYESTTIEPCLVRIRSFSRSLRNNININNQMISQRLVLRVLIVQIEVKSNALIVMRLALD